MRRDKEKSMANRGKKTLVENVLVLALMGIVAGAVGGLAVGALTSPKASSTTSAVK
jgi:type II secretory pathway pseudopilin PulG